MRPFLRLAVAVLALAGFAAPALAQPVPLQPTEEEVTAFAADITVVQDGTVRVTERIQYYFPTERHGIYRDLPEQYRFEDGSTVRVPVSVTGVTGADGSPLQYVVDRNRVGLRIRIGDPDKTVSGWQHYVIAYELAGALRYDQAYPDGVLHDELFWNVTGHGWDVPLRRVSATVSLPDGIAMRDVRVKCYTGPVGSTESDCVAGVQGTKAQFASNGPLTVVVGWPQGQVARLLPPPAPWWEQWLPYMPWLLPLLAFAFMFSRWNNHGRDPKGRGTLMAEYDPPKGMTPAEAGVLLDENAGMKDISAIIVDLAVRGYVKIREVEKKGFVFSSTDYEIVKTRAFAADDTVKPFEKELLHALFGTAESVTVSHIKQAQKFHLVLPTIKSLLYQGMVADGYYPANPVHVRAAWIGGGLAVTVAASLVLGNFIGSRSPEALAWMFAAGALTAAIVAFFGWRMPRRTEKGAAALDHVRGFREYLDKAEKYRIQWQEKEGIFEKFLPYAMAFGVAQHWSKAFEGMQMQPPTWYEGRAFGTGGFNPALFYASLNSMNGALTTAMQSAPQSSSSRSGFSGGGSGGGFGGGGGGSW